MRAATLVKALTEASGEKWVLVLPPWPLMPHWRTEGRSGEERTSIKWGMFFDLPSLSQYVPSLEFEDFLRLQGKNIGMVCVILFLVVFKFRKKQITHQLSYGVCKTDLTLLIHS